LEAPWAAAELLDEDRMIADATGNPPIAVTTMMPAAWRGQEREAQVTDAQALYLRAGICEYAAEEL
jgi:hypothetical protein